MPTFVKIGGDFGNISGSTSKGYIIQKKGRRIILKWGSIYSKSRKYYWAGKKLPMIKMSPRFPNIKTLETFYNDKIRRRFKEGYSKLPSRVKIYHNKHFFNSND